MSEHSLSPVAPAPSRIGVGIDGGSDPEPGAIAALRFRRGDKLYAWLLDCSSGTLPPSAAILRALPELRTVAGVSGAFLTLAKQGHIDERHGTWRHGRGHRIVRIVATGVVMRTAGCPLTFDDPPYRPSYPIGAETLRSVLDAVEKCAEHGEMLPRPERLGRYIGRSGYTTRRALTALRDRGDLTLERHWRHVAVLRDGRATL